MHWKFVTIDEAPPALERSFKAATKLRPELPTAIEMENLSLIKLSPLTEDIHFKAQESSQNADFDTREFLAIYKALQTINCD